VFVVGCLGGWEHSAKILFESESLSRDIKKSRKTREKIARCIKTGIGTRYDGESDTFVYENHGTDSRIKPVKISPTVTARWGTGGNNTPIALAENTIGRQPQNGGNGDGFTEGGPMYTLNASGIHGVAHSFKMRGGCDGGGKGYLGQDEKAFTLSTVQDQQIAIASSDKAGTLRANPGSGFRSDGTPVEGVAIQNMAVRRLTPVECERLQGFPDNYTNIKNNCPDGPRYKAMGNSMAVPVMRWIGERINEYEQRGMEA
jgi:DNA (cytosine-5)-methyltransferase 1